MATLQCNYPQQEKSNKQVHTQTTIAHSINTKVQGKHQSSQTLPCAKYNIERIFLSASSIRILLKVLVSSSILIFTDSSNFLFSSTFLATCSNSCFKNLADLTRYQYRCSLWLLMSIRTYPSNLAMGWGID